MISPSRSRRIFRLGQAYNILGDYRLAMACARRNVESLQGDLLYERLAMSSVPSVTSRYVLVLSLVELGAFAEGIMRGQEAVKIAEAAGHLTTLLHAYYCLGFVYLRKGDLQNALPMLERGLALCQTTDVPIWFHPFAVALGSAYALSGHLLEALALLEPAGERLASPKAAGLVSTFVAEVSEGYLLAGRLEEAHALAERTLVLTRAQKERGHQAYALHLLGEIAARHDPPKVEQAETYYREALALANELGMRPLQAHCHRGLGTLYGRVGREQQARAALSTAIALYRAMEMTFWLPQAGAALAQVDTASAPPAG
jgi:tetratricopeptide (TPR) repeat protein